MTTPTLRFKEFDADWALQNLGSLFSKRRDKGTSGIPTYSVTLNNGIINRDDLERNTPTNLSPQEHLLVKKNDLAYNMMRMWQGALGLAPTDGNVSPAYVVLKPSEEKTNSSFFEYYFKRNRQIHNFWAYSQGLTEDRLRLYFDDFKVIKINAPSKEEQTKIASFLSAVDEKISQLTQKHELLSQYKQGMMQKLFSQQIRFKADDGSEFGAWDTNRIRYVFTNKSRNFNPQTEENLPCIELEHLSQNTGKILETIDSIEQKSTKNLFEKNCVLFGKLRPYLRKFAKPQFKGVCSSEIWVLTGIRISNDYLFQYIQSEQFSELTNIQSGSKMPRADWNVISKAEIEYPCLDEQNKIANFLSAIDQKIAVVAQQIEQAKVWKKGLLQQMFV